MNAPIAISAAANDTAEQTTIARGTTYESAAWRAHRYADSFRITSLVNAGKRGKSCEVFSVYVSGVSAEDRMEDIAPAIFFAVRECVSVETMRAVLADAVLSGLVFEERSARGVDIPRGPAIEVVTELVDCRFTETEALCRFSFWLGGKPGGMKQDTLVGTQNRKDAGKAYQWAQNHANRSRLPGMTLSTFRAEMSAIGVRLS